MSPQRPQRLIKARIGSIFLYNKREVENQQQDNPKVCLLGGGSGSGSSGL